MDRIRTNRSRGTSVIVVVGVLMVVPVAHAGPMYSISDLGTLAGTTDSVATSINNAGQVVGISYNPSDGYFGNLQGATDTSMPQRFHGTGAGAQSFSSTGGQPAMIQPTGGLALSVNASGQSVGGSNVSINASGQYVGGPGVGIDTGSFNGNSSLTSNGTTTALPGFFSPLAINNAGQVVGFLDVGSGGGTGLHPAIYQQGQLTDLSSKTATGQFTDSKAIAINQGGDILVNSFSTAGNSASFLYHSSTGIVTELTGPPGMTNFMAAALNDKNQIVGGGSLDNNGTFQLLASLLPLNSSWSSLNATGINDSGQIVGQGLINGQEHAFLMTPVPQAVPEPGALALWALGPALVAMGLVRRAKSNRSPKIDR